MTGRFARRAAMRAALAGGGAAVGSSIVGRVAGRPGLAGPAAIGAAIVGSALELPPVAIPAAAIGLALLRRGRPGPASFVAAFVGAGAALATRRVWPVAPRTPAEVRRAHHDMARFASADGAGAVVIVNPSAGPALSANPADALREALPAARVIEVGDEGEMSFDDAMAEARQADVVGVAGGDGSVNAAAEVAAEAGLPLLVVPAGTLNHFARDLGVTGVDDAVAALRDGHAVAVDTAHIDGRPFLNTASFGTYGDLVDAREQLEDRIGKWPALVVALVRVLRHGQPMQVELDGVKRKLWMVFIGNCRYEPPGFAPSWRERLDDGLLDIRLVDASEPGSRLRLVLAVLTGRLAKCRAYEAFTAESLAVRSLAGPMRLARDGEVFDGGESFVIEKGGALAVYAPAAS